MALYLIIINITIHTLLFTNAFLFSDKYIIKRNINLNKKIEIEYIITNEYDRIIYSFIITFFVIKILKWLLDLKSQEEGELYIFLKSCKKCFKIISIIIIICLHFAYFYFFLIFGTINPYSQLPILLSTLITLALYIVFYTLICFMIYLQEKCCNNNNSCKNICELIRKKIL